MRVRHAQVLLAASVLMACTARQELAPSMHAGARLRSLPEPPRASPGGMPQGLARALETGRFDFAAAHEIELPVENRRLVAGLRLVSEGRLAEALPVLSSLADEAEDGGVRGLAASLEAQLLFEACRYVELAAILDDGEDDGARLVRKLATLPPMRVEASSSNLDALRVGPKGHPALAVEAGGRRDVWYFDTGAAQSIVSASRAKELGLELLPGDPIHLTSSTSLKPPARIALLDELRFGQVLVRSVPLLVFEDDDLRFELDSGQVIQIHGLVGWPIIRELRTELDYAGKRYEAELSVPSSNSARNLTWLGYPLVHLQSPAGVPLLFGLDTGSWNTSVTELLLERLDIEPSHEESVEVGGLGGMEMFDVKVVPDFEFVVGATSVELAEVRTEGITGSNSVVFFDCHGVLGSDIARRGTLILDPKNGHLELSPAGTR